MREERSNVKVARLLMIVEETGRRLPVYDPGRMSMEALEIAVDLFKRIRANEWQLGIEILLLTNTARTCQERADVASHISGLDHMKLTISCYLLQLLKELTIFCYVSSSCLVLN